MGLLERILSSVSVDETGCWLWPSSYRNGYGRISVKGKKCRAHRVMYEQMVGPISPGLEIDHTCHNQDVECLGGHGCQHRRCVNPDHLEAVSHRENVARGRGNQEVFLGQVRQREEQSAASFEQVMAYAASLGDR